MNGKLFQMHSPRLSIIEIVAREIEPIERGLLIQGVSMGEGRDY